MSDQFADQFADSHGYLWLSCDPGHPGAQAFGPTGAARPTGSHYHDLGHEVRLVTGDDGWDRPRLVGRFLAFSNGHVYGASSLTDDEVRVIGSWLNREQGAFCGLAYEVLPGPVRDLPGWWVKEASS